MKPKLFLLLIPLSLTACASKNPITAIPSTKKGSAVPSLTAPEVRRIWVTEKIEGNKFIEGHYMYVIDKTSVWSR